MNEKFDLDKLTLEHFVNKHSYRKYLAKKNPEIVLKQKLISDRHDKLMDLFSALIKDQHADNLILLQPKFLVFVEECLIHLDNLEQRENEEEEAEDVREDEDEQVTSPIEYWKSQNVSKT